MILNKRFNKFRINSSMNASGMNMGNKSYRPHTSAIINNSLHLKVKDT